MKAKVIKTGEVVEVQQRANGSWASINMNTTKFFDESELDFEFQDWDVFRREAAKDLLPLATQMKDYRGFPEECVSLAIQVADELIKQLKGGNR